MAHPRTTSLPVEGRRSAVDTDALWIVDTLDAREPTCSGRTAKPSARDHIHLRALGRDRLRMFTDDDPGHGPSFGWGRDAGRQRRVPSRRDRHRGSGRRHAVPGTRPRGTLRARDRRG
ncbi:MAG: hypothetical protein HOV94_13040 [Saccharothrix sp.]|nr:hypothetical protein [Saccharothrix sp.]